MPFWVIFPYSYWVKIKYIDPCPLLYLVQSSEQKGQMSLVSREPSIARPQLFCVYSLFLIYYTGKYERSMMWLLWTGYPHSGRCTSSEALYALCTSQQCKNYLTLQQVTLWSQMWSHSKWTVDSMQMFPQIINTDLVLSTIWFLKFLCVINCRYYNLTSEEHCECHICRWSRPCRRRRHSSDRAIPSQRCSPNMSSLLKKQLRKKDLKTDSHIPVPALISLQCKGSD
jgi:hypothetical protein